MKKTIFLITSLCFYSLVIASSAKNIRPSLNANEIFIQFGNSGKFITLLELSQIKPREFAKSTERKFTFFERFAFEIIQKKLGKSINQDGTINTKKVEKYLKLKDGTNGFHAGGLFLGLLLGIIGVLIAYLIKDEKKNSRVKWAWIGFGTWALAYVVLYVVYATGL